jgi:iron complex outermembrane recepter protein
MFSFIAVNDPKKAVSFFKPWISYTYNDYLFEDYKTQSFDWTTFSVKTVDNSGKQVTGVVPNSLSAGMDLESKYGLYFNTLFYYYDKIPLNDANTYFSDAYSLLNLKLGFRKVIHRIGFDVFAGLNNAMDTQYSSLLLYNADATSFGAPPPFYNPAAGINFYSGVKIKYNFK